MEEEQKYTPEQFMEIVKEGIVLINRAEGSKKSFKASDYTTLGKVQIALEKYFFMQMINKHHE